MSAYSLKIGKPNKFKVFGRKQTEGPTWGSQNRESKQNGLIREAKIVQCYLREMNFSFNQLHYSGTVIFKHNMKIKITISSTEYYTEEILGGI